MNYDLFGNEIIEDVLLRDKFLEPPFSILDTKQGGWQKRKNEWARLGIQGEIGRDAKCNANLKPLKGNPDRFEDKQVSIFDPALVELMYRWFCVNNGTIIDPFAGGSVRGIIANYLGYKYTGIDIRQEQIESNYKQARDILKSSNYPMWLTGDSNTVLDKLSQEFDFALTCPPYFNLEVYSDLPNDISTMDYHNFINAYKSILSKTCKLLKYDSFFAIVVGEVRDSKGGYIGFVPDTIKVMQDIGMTYYNEIILLNQLGNAAMRASSLFPKSQKVVKVHQNVLIFKKDK